VEPKELTDPEKKKRKADVTKHVNGLLNSPPEKE